MDIVRFKGGLGNQMFDYALYWALKQRGRDVRIDLSFFDQNPDFPNPYKLTDYFHNIQFQPLEDDVFWQIRQRWEEVKKHPEEKEYYDTHLSERWFWAEESIETGCYREEVFETKSCTFVGWWQTEKYFREYRQDLLREFEFQKGEKKLQEIGAKLEKSNNTVIVHIRLDNSYYEAITVQGFHRANIIQEKYYERALEKVRELLGKDVQYVIFSDMVEQAKKVLPIENAVYIECGDFENYEDWYDMYLMGKCRCNIIANSSFSWWAAWLNQRDDQIVIAPQHWENRYDELLKTTDIWAEGWIKL